MAGHLQILSLFLLLICKSIMCMDAEAKEELVESESKDGKLEIIKRIKKVNEDGSYTIGYEADDGSFKIESRDVLGNIKGTYGFIDDEGQIKRVSYSTSNSSEVLTKAEPPSVVQRIPKINKTISTKRPTTTYSTTQSPPTTNNIVQTIARRRTTTTTTTSTPKPNYSEIINISSGTTTKPVIYTSSPRVLLQGRSNVGSTTAPHVQHLKSEGQLDRPEIIIKPTEIPLYRRLALKQELLEDKPVIELPEVRGNILRRELSQEKNSEFDPREHIVNLRQSDGDDIPDIYSGSLTTNAPRHVFSTTLRPRILSTTTAPVALRPSLRYSPNYQPNVLEHRDSSTPEYAQESSTTESTADEATPTPVPIVQIPANRPTQEPLVAIRHPFQRGTILVPLSQLQRRIVPVENARDESMENQYILQNIRQNNQYVKDTTQKPIIEQQPRPIVIRRLPPPPLRPIPVHVDENGYIREVEPQAIPTPYPIPVPVTPIHKYTNNEVRNEIDDIEPPVSTRDFQKLLHQLILRQTRLERTHYNQREQSDYVQPTYRPVYQGAPAPYVIQRVQNAPQNGPVQFVQPLDQNERQRQYSMPNQPQSFGLRQSGQEILYNDQSFVPTRRVARLLPNRPNEQETEEEYLPPDIREMLLLRMLQLAINPALPLEEEEQAEPTTSLPQYKKPVRNVEILGEEPEEMKMAARPARVKRPQNTSSRPNSESTTSTTAAAYVAPSETFYDNGATWLKTNLFLTVIIIHIL